jgi:hypothetical protein
MPELEVADVNESSEYSMTDYDLESTGDLAYVLHIHLFLYPILSLIYIHLITANCLLSTLKHFTTIPQHQHQQ